MGEQAVTIQGADGPIDAFFYIPEGTGPWQAVIMFTDIMGVRAANQGMARRLSDEGFAVLLPNPFYRIGPMAAALPAGQMGEPGYLEKLLVLKDDLTPARVHTDTAALLAWLQRRPEVAGKAGVVGYCMSGGYALRAAADFPDRIGAAASFHGGGLATDDAGSPHLRARDIRAPLLIGHATDDALIPAEQIERLHATLDEAGVAYEGETYPASHGWCVPGGRAYDEAAAERAWSRMVALFKVNLKQD